MTNPHLSTPADFWAHVDQGQPGCHPWTGAVNEKGYGKVHYQARMWLAHRLAFVLSGGILTPEKPFVLHNCDNPPCCKFTDLRAGTSADNHADMWRRRRAHVHAGTHYAPSGDDWYAAHPAETQPRGEGHGCAKLTEAAVREIRASSESVSALARRFEVSRLAIRNARDGVTWRHVT